MVLGMGDLRNGWNDRDLPLGREPTGNKLSTDLDFLVQQVYAERKFVRGFRVSIGVEERESFSSRINMARNTIMLVSRFRGAGWCHGDVMPRIRYR